MFIVFSYFFLYFCRIYWYFSFAILILYNWVFPLLFLVSLARGLSILFTFSKNQLLVLLISSIVFLISILLISSLIFMISFLLLTSGFVCSSFPNSFRWWVKLSIWDLSSFFEEGLYCYEFPSEHCFAVSCRFWVIVSSLSFFSRYF